MEWFDIIWREEWLINVVAHHIRRIKIEGEGRITIIIVVITIIITTTIIIIVDVVLLLSLLTNIFIDSISITIICTTITITI